MSVTPLTVLHIAMGTVAIFAGAGALAVTKGERLHRRIGTVFFASMLVMSSSGAFLAYLKTERINVVAGVITFYLVATAWLTVRRKEGKSGLLEISASIVALAIGAFAFTLGMEAAASETGFIDSEPIPAPVYFVFSAIAILGGILDIKVLNRGVFGKFRIARHLWRMTLGMLIATASLFLGQSQVFPELIQDSILLILPVIAVIVLLIFWLIRVRFTGWWKEEEGIS